MRTLHSWLIQATIALAALVFTTFATGTVELNAPVTTAAGQTETIKAEFPSSVSEELPLGVVVDDGVPF